MDECWRSLWRDERIHVRPSYEFLMLAGCPGPLTQSGSIRAGLQHSANVLDIPLLIVLTMILIEMTFICIYYQSDFHHVLFQRLGSFWTVAQSAIVIISIAQIHFVRNN